MLPLTIFAQTVEPPTDWTGVIANFNGWFATLAGIAAVTVFVSGFINTLFKITKKIGKQIVAWLVAIILTVVGNLLNLGFMSEFPWLTTLAYGFAAGLVANGMFDIPTVTALLQFLKLKEKKE
jgi:sterol desaturase/sphingolipid hydroxylase (fatty acid hydroxylase superfamily)